MGTGVISLDLKAGTAPIFKKIQERLRQPMRGGGGASVARVMRHGAGSVEHQFLASAEFTPRGGTLRWPPTKPFGTRKPSLKPLRRTGSYQRAWTGEGSGSITQRSAKVVRIGVDRQKFPQVTVFQKSTFTKIFPKRMGKGGRFAMGWALGLKYNVWLSNARLRKGLLVPGRAVSINPKMMRRASIVLREWIINGNAQSARFV